MAEDTPDWALNDEEAAGETHSPSAPPEGTLSEGCQTDDELAPNWMKPGQQPEEDNEEYVNVDDLEHQPGWMSKQQAPSSEDKSSIGSMREQKYKPAWSQSGEDPTNRQEPDAFRGSVASSQARGQSEGCWSMFKKIFCSFRTTLVPLLVIISFISLFSVAIRAELACKWSIWWFETYSVASLVLACVFIYGIVKGNDWMCSGWFFSGCFSLLSLIVALCEWLNDVGDDATCHEKTDNGAVDNWMVPLASTLLIFCWALSSYLFSRGSKTIEKEHQLLSNAY